MQTKYKKESERKNRNFRKELVKDLIKFNKRNNLVQVFPIGSYDLDTETSVKFGVNWSSIGTVSVKETHEFMSTLSSANEIASRLNRLEMMNDEYTALKNEIYSERN